MDDLFAPPPPPGSEDGAPSDSVGPPPPPPPSDGGPPGPDAGTQEPPAAPAPEAESYGAQPTQPTYQQAYAPAAQAKAGGGSGKKTILIVIVAIVLLCCCVTVGGGIFLFQSDIFDDVSTTTLDEPTGMSSNDQGIVGEAGTVAVWLSWDSGADMDLEIWDASGDEYLTKSYAYIGDDITDGSVGDEYFEFTSYSDKDFSFGQYVVSVYYFGGDGPPEVPVTVTVQDVDGRIQTFEKPVQYDIEFDQWHAFRIDAATGEVTPLDQWH